MTTFPYQYAPLSSSHTALPGIDSPLTTNQTTPTTSPTTTPTDIGSNVSSLIDSAKNLVILMSLDSPEHQEQEYIFLIFLPLVLPEIFNFKVLGSK